MKLSKKDWKILDLNHLKKKYVRNLIYLSRQITIMCYLVGDARLQIACLCNVSQTWQNTKPVLRILTYAQEEDNLSRFSK